LIPATPMLKFKKSDASGTIYFDNAQGRPVESTMKMKMAMEINIMGKRGPWLSKATCG